MFFDEKIFLDFLESKVGCGYILGSQGEKCTPELRKKLAPLNTAKNNEIAKKWDGKECYDCSGLGVAYFLKNGLISKDYIADAIFYQLCTPIKKEELKSTDCVFIKTPNKGIIHIGYYLGNDNIIEAKGTPYGVVRSKLSKSDFNLYGRLKFARQPETNPINPIVKFFNEHSCLSDVTGWDAKVDNNKVLSETLTVIQNNWEELKKIPNVEYLFEKIGKNLKL